VWCCIVKYWCAYYGFSCNSYRADKITTAMAGMPARITKYEADMQARKPKKDLMFMMKRARALGRK
jgi:hypothetical protein